MSQDSAFTTPKLPCGSCHGAGQIFQDIADTDTRARRCGECEGHGAVAASRWYRSALQLGTTPTATSSDRYCELCQDAAASADLQRKTGRTIHRNKVCILWQLDVLVSDIRPGNIINSYRLLNYYAPMLVEKIGDVGFDNKIPVTLRPAQYQRATPVGNMAFLSFDSRTIVRDFAYNDLMGRSSPEIATTAYDWSRIPSNWHMANSPAYL